LLTLGYNDLSILATASGQIMMAVSSRIARQVDPRSQAGEIAE
jgi:hypothetical protein